MDGGSMGSQSIRHNWVISLHFTLIFIWRSYLVIRCILLTQNSIKHPCSTRDLCPHVLLSLSLSLSLWLMPWSTEAYQAHFPAWASKTTWEGTLHLREWYKFCPRALLVFWVIQGVLASFFLSLSYCWLRTTRFWSIKGPQQVTTVEWSLT